MEEEKWLNIRGKEGIYSISNWGRLKSHAQVLNYKNREYHKKEKILKLNPNEDGYLIALVPIGGNFRSKKLHRLVAEHFVTRVEGKNSVNHKDGNKLNNRADNLEWGTIASNNIHAHDTGLHKYKISSEDVIKIKEVYSTGLYSQKEVGSIFGINACHVSRLINHKRRWRVGNNIKNTQNILSCQ